VNLSHVFAGQNGGVTQVGERIWLVTFMRYDLGDKKGHTPSIPMLVGPIFQLDHGTSHVIG
jgi:hypothetical protein